MDTREPSWDQENEDPDFMRLIDAPVAEQARLTASLGLGRFAVQHLRGGCLGRCVFCCNPGTSLGSPINAWTGIAHHLLKAPDVELLCIGGNEPLLHPRVEAVINLARERGYARVQMMSSCLPLALRGVARRLRDAGLTELAVPIFSTRAEVHDEIFGARVHAALIRALDNAAAAGLRLRLHTLALRSNLNGLPSLSEWARRRWGVRVAVAMVRAKPGIFDYGRAAPSLDAIIRILKGNMPLLLGFPLCAVKSMETEESRPPALAESTALYFTIQRRVRTRICSECGARSRCPGVVKAHAAAYGSLGLRALETA